jgi:hypothetical protein
MEGTRSCGEAAVYAAKVRFLVLSAREAEPLRKPRRKAREMRNARQRGKNRVRDGSPYGRRHAALCGSIHDSPTPRMVGRHVLI